MISFEASPPSLCGAATASSERGERSIRWSTRTAWSSAICARRPARAVPPPPAARPARSSFGAIAGSIVHNLDTSHIPAGAFGPFRPDVGLVERVAGLRALAALVSVHCGSDHAAVDALRRAEAD